jgi:hypothetical protein
MSSDSLIVARKPPFSQVTSVDLYYVFLYAKWVQLRGPTAVIAINTWEFTVTSCSSMGLAYLMEGVCALFRSGLVVNGRMEVNSKVGTITCSNEHTALTSDTFTDGDSLHALYHAKLKSQACFPTTWVVSMHDLLRQPDVRWMTLQPILAYYIKQCVGGSVSLALNDNELVENAYPFLNFMEVVESKPRTGCVWNWKTSKLRRIMLHGTGVKKFRPPPTVVATYEDVLELMTSSKEQVVVSFHMHTQMLLVEPTMFLVESTTGLKPVFLEAATKWCNETDCPIEYVLVVQAEFGTELLVCVDKAAVDAEVVQLEPGTYVLKHCANGAEAAELMTAAAAAAKRMTAFAFIGSYPIGDVKTRELYFIIGIPFLKTSMCAPVMKHNGVRLSMDLSAAKETSARVNLRAIVCMCSDEME